MITVGDIYNYIDTFAPFEMQQSYDNSGICVGSRNRQVKRVLTTLDITCDAVKETVEKNCELIISHHPVIFRPLKNLDPKNPAIQLAAAGKSAICIHTSYDSAKGGMNDLLAARLGFKTIEPLAYEEGKPMGYVCTQAFECSAAHLATVCKKKLSCDTVRYSDSSESIKKIAVCSGSGGSLLNVAIEKGCEALITGDVKHSDFIAAKNAGFCLIDAGHFHTENIFHEALAEKLAEEFPELVIIKAVSSEPPMITI